MKAKKISTKLASATCALLGTFVSAPVAAEEARWDINTSVLFALAPADV